MPNPSPGIFTIEAPAEIGAGDITITDISGKLVFNDRWTENTRNKKVEVSGLSKGTYFLQLKTERSIHTQRLVIQ